MILPRRGEVELSLDRTHQLDGIRRRTPHEVAMENVLAVYRLFQTADSVGTYPKRWRLNRVTH